MNRPLVTYTTLQPYKHKYINSTQTSIFSTIMQLHCAQGSGYLGNHALSMSTAHKIHKILLADVVICDSQKLFSKSLELFFFKTPLTTNRPCHKHICSLYSFSFHRL